MVNSGQVTFDGVSNVTGRATSSKHLVNQVEDEKEVPTLIPGRTYPDLPTFKSVLDVADVVLHVLDARDPSAGRSKHLEEILSHASGSERSVKLAFILNKIGIL